MTGGAGGQRTTVGLGQLRRRTSELVRRAEAGEVLAISVNGRDVAQPGPLRSRHWRRGADLADVFAGPPDADWAVDRELPEGAMTDPFLGS